MSRNDMAKRKTTKEKLQKQTEPILKAAPKGSSAAA